MRWKSSVCLLGIFSFLLAPRYAALVNSWWGFLPLLFSFFCFARAFLGWGLWLEKRVGGGEAGVFLLSSLVAVGFAFVMGHLGFLGPNYSWVFVLFLVWGIYLAPLEKEKRWLFSFGHRWLDFLLLFVFGLRLLTAYLPQGHGDPLLYHLMAPRLWNLQGAVGLNTDLPIPLLASTWEYFYLWPQVLFTTPMASVKELVLAQIFCQWIHLFWGLYGALFVVRELWRETKISLGAREGFLLFVSFLFVASMQWTASLAKNDCAVAFWCLGAWLYLRKPSPWHWLLAGTFAGLAVAGKINAILFLIPIALLEMYKLFWVRKISSFPWLVAGVLGFVLGAVPIYFRNWLETQNPFYTMFSHIFPGPWVSQSWADHFSAHQPSEHKNLLVMLWFRLQQLSRESPAYWLWLLLPAIVCFPVMRKKIWLLREWILIFLLSLVICVVALMPTAEVRYLGASLWIGALVGVYGYLVLCAHFPKFQIYGHFLLLVVILATSKLPTHFLWKFPKIAPGEAVVLQHTAGKAKAWLREHVKSENLVVLYGDNETYYLSNLRVTVLTERPDIDRATYGKKNVGEFLAGLCATSGARFLLDVRPNASLALRFPGNFWDQAVLYEADGARVYDLVKLQNLVLKKPMGCGTT